MIVLYVLDAFRNVTKTQGAYLIYKFTYASLTEQVRHRPGPALIGGWNFLFPVCGQRHSSAERRPGITDVKNGVAGWVRSGLSVTFAPENTHTHGGKLSAVIFQRVCLSDRQGTTARQKDLGNFQDMVFGTWDLNFGAWEITLEVSKTET